MQEPSYFLDPESSSTTSINQSDSLSAVIIEIPASSVSPGTAASLRGMSSAPKKNSQSDNGIEQAPRYIPGNCTPTLSSATDRMEQSTESPIDRSDALNLIRALESLHPLNIESASAGDAFITDVSLLFRCSEQRAKIIAPFLLSTSRIARRKRNSSSTYD